VGWGCGFFDPDNDGRPDIFYCNGHVYPELDQIHGDLQYREPRVLYRNMGNGRFEDVSRLAGSCVTTPAKGRGSAFGDFNNDGCTDIVVNNHNSIPSLIRCDRMNHNHWITIKVEGVKSNRSGIGTRLKCVAGNLKQIDEVRSGGSYLSQNDLRVHFGLGSAEKVDILEMHWPSGRIDVLRNLAADQFLAVREGAGFTRIR
jgi:hypothetical protein